MRSSDIAKIRLLGGQIKGGGGNKFVFFPGPPEAPENSLSIPEKDFGYSKENGIFRKSLCPENRSEINL